MRYLSEGTPFPVCTMCPEFLLNFHVSGTAKMVYLELLRRILMERRTDDRGVYLTVASVRELSEVLSKSQATIKRAIAELESKKLLDRRGFERGVRKRFYLLVPDERNP